MVALHCVFYPTWHRKYVPQTSLDLESRDALIGRLQITTPTREYCLFCYCSDASTAEYNTPEEGTSITTALETIDVRPGW